jgi:2-hydroxyacyl-CoA lyase 1
MHFGLPPRFSSDVRLIQLDIAGDEIGRNVNAEVGLVGDGRAIASQLNAALENRQWFYPDDTPWRQSIGAKAAENAKSIQPMMDDDASPTNYYRALKDISAWVPRDAIIVSEGANTMDIGRTQLPNFEPRTRLDAGSYGTMGVGFGFAVAAAVVNPDRPIVSVSGDSAFGFSGMECETLCRYNLPVKVVVLNNGGIGQSAAVDRKPGAPPLPGVLTMHARYDKVMSAFGGLGLHVEDPKQLEGALAEAMAFEGPACVNVAIHPKAGRKPQQFGWLTT